MTMQQRTFTLFLVVLLASPFIPVSEAQEEEIQVAFARSFRRVQAGIQRTVDSQNNQTGARSPGSLFASIRQPPSEVARQRSAAAEVAEQTILALEDGGISFANLSPADQQMILELAGCEEPLVHTGKCDYKNKYRTIDGVCNNLNKPEQGAASTAFKRLLPPQYENDINEPKGWDPATPYNGFPLPSPRLVSTKVVSTMNFGEDSRFSMMLMQWGQFHDHDLTFTPMVVATNGFENGVDCDQTCENVYPCFSIPTPPDDPRIAPDKCIGATRSAATCANNELPYKRQQLNGITSYIDASNVYGSSEELSNRLRELNPNRGDLKTGLLSEAGKPYMPFDPEDDDCLPNPDPTAQVVHCFFAGDERSNEQAALTAMHTIWVREHNRIAKRLRDMNPFRDPDEVFQEARKIVGAMHQVITYSTWLPKMLGDSGIAAMGPYSGYDDGVDASVANAFATAAFRVGHGLIRPFLHRLKEDLTQIKLGNLELHKGFFSPWRIVEEGGIDPLLRGMFGIQAKLFDPRFMVTAEVTEKLFALANNVALDLASLNIARGREHGLPGYNAYREKCGLTRVTTFAQLSGEIPQEVIARLEEVYQHPDNIDLWVGGLAETKTGDAKIGPTFLCIIRNQFQALRDGDRFWYEKPGVFTPEQLVELKKTTLSKVVCDNGDNITKVQRDIFLSAHYDDMVECVEIPSVNLDAWKQEGVCVCRMLGDPIVSKYTGNNFALLDKKEEYVLSELAYGACRFKVEVQVGYYGQGGLLIPKWLKVTLDQGNAVIKIKDNKVVEYIVPSAPNGDASPSSYTYTVTPNVKVSRNADYVVITDSKCSITIGYDSEGLNTVATIVVPTGLGDLTGKCGTCGGGGY